MYPPGYAVYITLGPHFLRQKVLKKYQMKFILITLSALLLTGCATTSVKEYRGPDGRAIKTVKCSSERTKCFVEASSSCPDGGSYQVLSSESHAGGLLADALPGPVTWYSMTFSCGPSDGSIPDFKFGGPQYTPPPAPVIIKQRPTTTHCNAIGNSVTCNSY
jgi:hypothetical protein